MRQIGRPLAALMLALLFVGTASAVVASPQFDLGIADPIETPERTVEAFGTEYRVDAVGVFDRGESIGVAATVPGDTLYRIDVRNTDDQVVDFRTRTGSTDVTFETDTWPVGTYVIALDVDGTYETIQPIVVQEAAIGVDHPGEAVTGEAVTVTVGGVPDDGVTGVEVAIWANDTVETFVGEEASDGTWTVSVATAGLEPGSYALYAAALGEETDWNERELLAIADGDPLRVTVPENGEAPGDGLPGLTDDNGGEPVTDGDPADTDDGLLRPGSGGTDDESDDAQVLWGPVAIGLLAVLAGVGVRLVTMPSFRRVLHALEAVKESDR